MWKIQTLFVEVVYTKLGYFFLLHLLTEKYYKLTLIVSERGSRSVSVLSRPEKWVKVIVYGMHLWWNSLVQPFCVLIKTCPTSIQLAIQFPSNDMLTLPIDKKCALASTIGVLHPVGISQRRWSTYINRSTLMTYLRIFK